ncbi:hypothetical protein ACVBEJ_04295 [Porticoccus sp. GXU_MW_L64]
MPGRKLPGFFACGLLPALEQGAHCWVNTMWDKLSPGHYDDLCVLNPDKHWGHLINLGVTMFQTDRPQALIEYLSENNMK